MKAVIIVTPKPSVFDPQGEAVCRAVQTLGLKKVTGVRIGKYIEVDIEGGVNDATRKRLEEVSHELLSNPVIEDYRLELPGAAPRRAAAPKRPAKPPVAVKAPEPKTRPVLPTAEQPAPAGDWRPGDGKKKKDKKADKKKAHHKDKKKGKKKDRE